MMRRRQWLQVLAMLGSAVTAGAQNPPPKPKPVPPSTRIVGAADFRGTWEGKSMMGPSDSIVTTFAITVSADGSAWTLLLPDRDLLTLKVITIGGDSVVTEAGPYTSVLRGGETVTTRMTGHLKGRWLAGTFEAHYASGAVAKGTTLATRVKM